MTFKEFLIEIAGEYIPRTLPDGTVIKGLAGLDFEAIFAYLLVAIVLWWIFHMLNNMFFGRRK